VAGFTWYKVLPFTAAVYSFPPVTPSPAAMDEARLLLPTGVKLPVLRSMTPNWLWALIM